MDKIRVGTIVIDKPLKSTRTYEVAAWFTELELTPGEYPLYLSFSHIYRKPTLTSGDIPAVIVDENTQSLYGGVPVGKQDKGNIGKSATHKIQVGGDYSSGGFSQDGFELKVDVDYLKLEPTTCSVTRKPVHKIAMDMHHPDFIKAVEGAKIDEAIAKLKWASSAVLSVRAYQHHESTGFFEQENIVAMINKGINPEMIEQGLLIHSLVAQKADIAVRDMPLTVEAVTRDYYDLQRERLMRTGAVNIDAFKSEFTAKWAIKAKEMMTPDSSLSP